MRPEPKLTTAKAGFSLVEVLVALGILGLALVMFGYFPGALRLSRVSESEASQSAYMRSYLEDVKSAWQGDAYFDLAFELDGDVVVEPPEPPTGTNVEVTITGDEGVVYSYPGGAVSEDVSALRNITIRLQDDTGKTQSLQTQIVRPLSQSEDGS